MEGKGKHARSSSTNIRIMRVYVDNNFCFTLYERMCLLNFKVRDKI